MKEALTDAVIGRLAGPDVYRRGLDYFTHGHVETIEENKNSLRATVRGDKQYVVHLSADAGVLDYQCDCQASGVFCKHCAAAAFAWLNRHSAKRPKTKKKLNLDDAARILQDEEKDALIQLMLEWAKSDRPLKERILLHAARRAGPDSSAAAVHRAFEQAVRVHGGYIGYREASGWARRVDNAIDAIDQMLKDGQPAAVVELSESALGSLSNAILTIDDSAGHFADLRDRLQELHYQACVEAPPDPVDLARRLFEAELKYDFDVFYGAAERYAKILGDRGLAAYRKLAEAAWSNVPVRTAGDRWPSTEHSHATRIMESLARASNDIEEQVAVMSRDLAYAYGYLQIAEVYRKAKQYDNALLWAEKGLQAFPTRTDNRLREFAADEYHRRNRHDDALKLIWAEFVETLSLGRYIGLEAHATTAGAWPEWRAKAFAELRQRIAKTTYGDRSILVEILLYERKIDEAWHEATAGTCGDSLWLRLADERTADHPEQAGPVYWMLAERAVAAVRNGRYEEPVELLIKAAATMRRIGRAAEFERNLVPLLKKYSLKRNLFILIEKNRASLFQS